jgi:hypothetical protein
MHLPLYCAAERALLRKREMLIFLSNGKQDASPDAEREPNMTFFNHLANTKHSLPDIVAVEAGISKLAANDLAGPSLWSLVTAAVRAVSTLVDRAFLAPVSVAYARSRLFHELNALSDRSLADIGLRRTDIAKVVYGAYEPKTATATVANDRAANDTILAA